MVVYGNETGKIIKPNASQTQRITTLWCDSFEIKFVSQFKKFYIFFQ